MQAHDLKERQGKARELREKKDRDLREVKDMLKKNKQEDRLVIRNNSLRYDQTIRKNRKLELELREKLVKEVRKDKENYKQSLADSRSQEYSLPYADVARRKSTSSGRPWPK